jgi:hypothetical protein
MKHLETSSLPPPHSSARPGKPPRSTRGLARQLGLWSASGVLAATIISVCSNILAARFYTRWDVTSAGLYTLSGPSLETLRGLSEPVEVLVFLSQSDPQLGGIQRLLGQYEAETRLLRVRYIDPDRDPAQFIALQNRYRLMQGRSEQGHLVSDAALLVTRGDARWVITTDDILSYDDERGTVQPQLEQAITEGLRQVLQPKPVEVCFSRGHREASIEDAGPSGLGGLVHMLQKNNYGTREVDLSGAAAEVALGSCDLVLVVAPGEAFAASATARLLSAVRRGKNVLLASGPSLDEENHSVATGLEPLLEAFGVNAQQQLIFERDPALALPTGVGGEVFLASPKAHAITEGLLKAGEARYRVLMQLAHGFEAGNTGAPTPLLVTSERAFSVADTSALASDAVNIDELHHDADGPFTVGMASELPGSGNAERRAARLVVLGSASPLLGDTWQDPTLGGTRRFVESALSWLVSRPSLVSLAEKPEHRVDLRFTEESMTQVVRYVLLYMPGTALALGLLILYRRRSARPPSKPARDEVAR